MKKHFTIFCNRYVIALVVVAGTLSAVLFLSPSDFETQPARAGHEDEGCWDETSAIAYAHHLVDFELVNGLLTDAKAACRKCVYAETIWRESGGAWNAWNGIHRGVLQYDIPTWSDTTRNLHLSFSDPDLCLAPVYAVRAGGVHTTEDIDLTPDNHIWNPYLQVEGLNDWVRRGQSRKWPNTWLAAEAACGCDAD